MTTVLFGETLFAPQVSSLNVYHQGTWTQEDQFSLENYMVSHAIDLITPVKFVRDPKEIFGDVFVLEGSPFELQWNSNKVKSVRYKVGGKTEKYYI